MRELRFHREVYDREAVDQSVEIFQEFAELERSEEEACWVVRVQAGDPARERRVAGELANYALGLTVGARGGQ